VTLDSGYVNVVTSLYDNEIYDVTKVKTSFMMSQISAYGSSAFSCQNSENTSFAMGNNSIRLDKLVFELFGFLVYV
jgi:hypothetical protein